MNKLIYNEVARRQPENEKRQVNEKTSFTHSPSSIFATFSKNASRLLLPKSFSKCVSLTCFRPFKWKVVLLVIYLFNGDSSKSVFFMLNMEFDVLLSTVSVK